MALPITSLVEPENTVRAEIKWTRPDIGAVYEEHSQAIYYLALRMLRDPAQAEDATHDVFLKACRAIQDFRGESNLRTWLYRIAINHCRNMAQTWHQRHVFASQDETMWEKRGHEESPLRILEVKELGERIQESLDAIPADYKLLLLLAADSQLSYEEIAGLTGQTADAVRGKLHRARKAFQLQFKNRSDS